MAMGETTCVMHAFSYTSGISNEAKEGNPINTLEESVSFGRFMSESLSWEKWSSFSRNRYVEEAEKFSKPGSVKQKKAYFEAHFKRMAALKAAALLEQANAAQVGDPDAQNEESEVHNDAGKNDDQTDLHSQELFPKSPPSDQQCVEKEVENSNFVANHNERNRNDGEDQSSTKFTDAIDQYAQTESEEHLMDVEKQNPNTEMECGLAKTEESHLKCSSISQDTLVASSPRSKRNSPLSAYVPSSLTSARKPKLSSYMPSTEAATSAVSSSPPTKSVVQPSAVHPGKENTFTPIGRKSWIEDPDKKRTPLRMSINRELNRLISPVIKKIGSSSKASNKDCSTPLRTPAKASVDGMTNDPSEMTPQSGKRRGRALFDSSACGSKAGGLRWQFLSAEGAKSPTGGRNKASSPIIPKSFCLRSKDRAPRRKERLEEKFNAKLTENIQQQAMLKEKPKDLAKLRQSFCFGSKLSSESFREKDSLKVPTEKSKATDEQLPKKGRSRLQNMTSLPPRRPVFKGIKNAKQKKCENASSHSSTE